MLGEITRALEERDQDQGHGARVAALAEPVAHVLGWTAQRIEQLRFGAVLHDIGKVRVSASLLRKPGPLTADEVAQIRVHPRAGAQIVLPLRDAHQALPYVLFHHEWWDGTGYPMGLKGRATPAEARLLAIADAFDAMTSPRPYRRPVAHDRALAEIEGCAGAQFDPHIAAVFCDVWSSRAVAAAS
jgi:HD-GYP domain-containing protein (c-di-GMP phosphodiesterase class II)